MRFPRLDRVSLFLYAARSVILVISAIVAAQIIVGRLTPLALAIIVAAPRALHAIKVMSRPRPAAPPKGYVGWPLWYHRLP